ncbi:MAG: BON domain-containing protein [Alphaproteobacteria bacterium]
MTTTHPKPSPDQGMTGKGHCARPGIRSIRRLRLGAAVVLALGAGGLTGACVTSAVVGVGASGAVAASEERGLGGALRDKRIKAVINYHLLDVDPKLLRGLATAVYEGRVLLTGIATTTAKRDAAVRIAWQAEGVKEVINEIVVDAKGESGSFARDTWISTKLRTKLLLETDIVGINYSIDTVRGTVHLLGVAQDREELDLVLIYARNLSYVRNVVNHVILKTDPRRQANQAKK